MSLYVLSHPWEVQDVQDGTVVPIAHRDLDVETVSILADELFELAQESGRPKLYLDFKTVHFLTSVAIGKLFAVDRRLRELGGHLVLCNLNSALQELFLAANWPGESTAEPER